MSKILCSLLLALLLCLGCSSSVESIPEHSKEPTPEDSVATPSQSPSAEPTQKPVVLTFAGDVHFEGNLLKNLENGRQGLGEFEKVFKQSDYTMVNLETAIYGGSGDPARKELEDPLSRYYFKTPASTLKHLRRAGVDALAMANNHAADFGKPGFRTTLKARENSNLAIVGIGKTRADAFSPAEVVVNGQRLAFFSADMSKLESRDPLWVARGPNPGIASVRSKKDQAYLAKLVETAREAGQVPIVYLHWGEEGTSCPTGSQQKIAQLLSEAGAAAIVGSHAHQLQAGGWLSNSYVAYGLGNFFWYHGKVKDTGVLQLTVTEGLVAKAEWIPGEIPLEGGPAKVLSGDSTKSAKAKWQQLNACGELQSKSPKAKTEEEKESKNKNSNPTPAPFGSYQSQVRILDPNSPELKHTYTTGCPVPPAQLRALMVSYWGMDGSPKTGVLVLHRRVVAEVNSIFRRLFEEKFPIHSILPMSDFKGDDEASMVANNTSGFNCRKVMGTDRWSDHSYGKAVDINPLQNPYVVGDKVYPPAGEKYASMDRSHRNPKLPKGGFGKRDLPVKLFEEAGWTWGGSFQDYHHFSRK